MIILNKRNTDLLIRSSLFTKSLCMKKFEYAAYRQQQIDASYTNTYNRIPSDAFSNLRIENQLSDGSKEKSEVKQFHGSYIKVGINTLSDTRSPQKSDFIDPIKAYYSKQHQQTSSGNNRVIKKSHP